MRAIVRQACQGPVLQHLFQSLRQRRKDVRHCLCEHSPRSLRLGPAKPSCMLQLSVLRGRSVDTSKQAKLGHSMPPSSDQYLWMLSEFCCVQTVRKILTEDVIRRWPQRHMQGCWRRCKPGCSKMLAKTSSSPLCLKRSAHVQAQEQFLDMGHVSSISNV